MQASCKLPPGSLETLTTLACAFAGPQRLAVQYSDGRVGLWDVLCEQVRMFLVPNCLSASEMLALSFCPRSISELSADTASMAAASLLSSHQHVCVREAASSEGSPDAPEACSASPAATSGLQSAPAHSYALAAGSCCPEALLSPATAAGNGWRQQPKAQEGDVAAACQPAGAGRGQCG